MKRAAKLTVNLIIVAMLIGMFSSSVTAAPSYATVYNKEGIYTRDVDGDALISSANVTLQGLTIKGNLYVAPGLGGTVILDNVRVTGKLITLSSDEKPTLSIGGSSSVREYNSTTYTKDYVYGDQRPFSPTLSARGDYDVGTRLITMADSSRDNRELKVELWYPAVIPNGVEQLTTYTTDYIRPDGGNSPTVNVSFTGRALRDAEMATPNGSGKFPLLVFSHGYPGSSSQMTYLTENLASKGYVIAYINHTGTTRDLMNSELDFASLSATRSQDVEFVIGQMYMLVDRNEYGFKGKVDPTNVGLMGYSMGALGAFNASGLGYADMAFTKNNPERHAGNPAYNDRKVVTEDVYGDPVELIPDNIIKAVVAAAPYGTQDGSFFSDDHAIAAYSKPLFVIMGDQDHISNSDAMKHFVLDKMNANERYLLVYQNARHNIITNPSALETTLEGMDPNTYNMHGEYAWDFGRLAVTNQHFITAFFDKYLKPDETGNTMDEYLIGLKEVPNGITDTWPGFSVTETSAIGVSNTQNMTIGMEFYYRQPGGL